MKVWQWEKDDSANVSRNEIKTDVTVYGPG